MEERQKMDKNYFNQIIHAFHEINTIGKTIPVSSKEMLGLEEVYASMSLYFRGGEDTDTMFKDD